MAILDRNDVYIDDSPSMERRKQIRRKNQMTSIAFLAACIAAFVVLIAGVVALFMWVGNDERIAQEAVTDSVDQSETVKMYTQEEMEAYAAILAAEEKEKFLEQLAIELNSGNTMVYTLRSVYEDHLVVASGGKYHFVPIMDELKKNDYQTENIVISDKDISYVISHITSDFGEAKKFIEEGRLVLFINLAKKIVAAPFKKRDQYVEYYLNKQLLETEKEKSWHRIFFDILILIHQELYKKADGEETKYFNSILS